jgi:hypothetical protein
MTNGRAEWKIKKAAWSHALGASKKSCTKQTIKNDFITSSRREFSLDAPQKMS